MAKDSKGISAQDYLAHQVMQNNEKPLVAIARGGYSGESEVSMGSAQQFMDSIDYQRFEAIFITIHKSNWSASDKDDHPLELDRHNLSIAGRQVDAVLIAIHGTPGEDGLLQGYLDMLGIPYQTGDVLNMSLTFSKFNTTTLLRQLGFTVSRSIMLRANNQAALDRVDSEVGFPCFIKPDRSGSSLGISKVKKKEELPAALELAFSEGQMVMAEKEITGRELTCGVIDLGDGPKTLPLCEVKTDREYFDYEAKYHSDSTQEIVPAQISESDALAIKSRSLEIFQALDCRGMVRIDYFLDAGKITTIEVNTVPGFSKASILPKMLRADGIGLERAVNDLVANMLKQNS